MKRFKVGDRVRVHPNASNKAGVVETVLKHGKYKVRYDTGVLYDCYDREIVAEDDTDE